jgi:hypothetical protein
VSKYNRFVVPTLGQEIPQAAEEVSNPIVSYTCEVCGVSLRSPHGLARHVHARHGGFAGLGRFLSGPSVDKAAQLSASPNTGAAEGLDRGKIRK